MQCGHGTVRWSGGSWWPGDRRLRTALQWARRMVLRARVRQMMARRAVRTMTAVGTAQSLGGQHSDAAGAATKSVTHEAAQGATRQMYLRHAAKAGVRVVALVTACEQRCTVAHGTTAEAWQPHAI